MSKAWYETTALPSQSMMWLGLYFVVGSEYFAVKFGTTVAAVNPRMTSQKSSDCGAIVKKSLSTRTHKCACGCELQRDVNAAINILNLAKA